MRYLFLAVLLVASASPAYADVRAEIEAFDKEMAAAANRGDSKAIAAMYTADAEIFQAGMAPVKGTAAIEKYFRDGLAGGSGRIHFRTLEVFSDDATTATEIGEYEWGDKSGKSLDHGHYIVVYRKESGHWKLYRDSPTSNVPKR